MSKEKTPVLAGAVPSFEHFMTSWERLAEKNQHLVPAIKVGLKFTISIIIRWTTRVHIWWPCVSQMYFIFESQDTVY